MLLLILWKRGEGYRQGQLFWFHICNQGLSILPYVLVILVLLFRSPSFCCLFQMYCFPRPPLQLNSFLPILLLIFSSAPLPLYSLYFLLSHTIFIPLCFDSTCSPYSSCLSVSKLPFLSLAFAKTFKKPMYFYQHYCFSSSLPRASLPAQ